ncbi:MAG TPA: ROK family protein [Gemmatimonadaceae bacterium]|jgi:glucokinase|nr:ROK family protein [Gemmatimonadaceae bacterium]
MVVAGAIDIGGTSTKIGVVAEDGSVVVRERIATSLHGEPLSLVDSIALAFRAMLARNVAAREIVGIGVSVAGFVTPDHSAMVHNANLPALREFPLRASLQERLGFECRLEVDSNASTLAELHYGAGKGVRRLLGLTIGTGIGGGVVIDGRLVRYTGECAGDLGHVIVNPGGRLCTCGARGCLEAEANSSALSERVGGRSVKEIIETARKGDALARDALSESGRWIGLGAASLAALFDPDAIVIGGGIAAAHDLLLDGVREAYLTHASPQYRDARVEGSTFDGWDGLVGAACLYLRPTP